MLNYKKAELRIQTPFQQYCKYMQKYSQILFYSLYHQSKYKICWFKEVMLGFFLNKNPKTTTKNHHPKTSSTKKPTKLPTISEK